MLFLFVFSVFFTFLGIVLVVVLFMAFFWLVLVDDLLMVLLLKLGVFGVGICC